MKGKFRNLIVTDKTTGEKLDGIPVYCPPKKHSPLGKEGFVIVGQLSAAKTLAKSDLDGVALRVLWQIISEIGMNKYINLNQSRSAKEMGLAPSHFNRALKQLIAAEIIIENFIAEHGKTYSLNPIYGWKGSPKAHLEALEEYEDRQHRSTKVSKVIETDSVEVTTTVTTTIKPKISVGNSRN